VEPLFLTGAVTAKWDVETPLAAQLAGVLKQDAVTRDRRDEIGLERGGRLKSAEIARRVMTEASQSV